MVQCDLLSAQICPTSRSRQIANWGGPEMPPQECRLTLAADYIHILLDPYEQQDLLSKLYDKLNGGWCPCVIGRRLPASL